MNQCCQENANERSVKEVLIVQRKIITIRQRSLIGGDPRPCMLSVSDRGFCIGRFLCFRRDRRDAGRRFLTARATIQDSWSPQSFLLRDDRRRMCLIQRPVPIMRSRQASSGEGLALFIAAALRTETTHYGARWSWQTSILLDEHTSAAALCYAPDTKAPGCT